MTATSTITAREAGRIIRNYLTSIGDTTTTARAREVSFEDLARASRVFVTLTGAPSYADRTFWDGVQAIGRAYGVVVD